MFAGFEQADLNTVCVTLDKLDKIDISGVVMELIEKGFDAEKINTLVEIINNVIENGIDAVLKYNVQQKLVADTKFLIDALNRLTNNKFDIKFDISIVRGQGYYTGTVYEFYTNGFGAFYVVVIGRIFLNLNILVISIRNMSRFYMKNSGALFLRKSYWVFLIKLCIEGSIVFLYAFV